jgi:uncharacterized protein
MTWRLALRKVLRIGLALGVIYLCLVAVLAVFQRNLIYYPSRTSTEALKPIALAQGVSPWLRSVEGERIGWRRSARHSPAAGQVLIVHGNAGHALHRTFYADTLQAVADLDVFILEYPGYGDRRGVPGEQSLFQAASEGLESLPGDKPVFILGESLGTGVACYLAGRHAEKISGVLLVAPYDSLANVAQNHMPWIPVRWILRDAFDSITHLRRYRGPIGFWVGGNDTVVPARFGRQLFEAYSGPKQLWDVPGRGHEDIVRQGPEWWRAVMDLWQMPVIAGG